MLRLWKSGVIAISLLKRLFLIDGLPMSHDEPSIAFCCRVQALLAIFAV